MSLSCLVDVYSFGILLHELISGEKPFYGYSSGKHMQQVVLGGERPKMDAHTAGHWPANLKSLMKHCWSPFPTLRPSFTEIKLVLQDILDGREDVRPACSFVDEKMECSDSVDPSTGGGFIGGLLHPLGRKKFRSKTTGSVDDGSGDSRDPAKDGFKGLKPPAKGGRSRTWGFGYRR